MVLQSLQNTKNYIHNLVLSKWFLLNRIQVQNWLLWEENENENEKTAFFCFNNICSILAWIIKRK